MAEQVGDPLGVLDVGLAPGHCLDVLGVDHQQLHIEALQQVEDRLPVDSRALHGHRRYPLLLQPVAEPEQLPSHRPIGPCLLPLVGAHAGDHGLLVDVQPAAALVDHLHRRAPSSNQAAASEPWSEDFPLRAPGHAGVTISSACQFADPTLHRARWHQKSTGPGTADPIFIDSGAIGHGRFTPWVGSHSA